MGAGNSATEKVKAIGNSYFAKGEYAKAKSAYSKALRYDKHNHMLLSNRCACFIKMGKLKQALEDALVNLKIAPSWVKTYYRLACVFIELNLFPEACHYLKLANAIDSNDKTIIKLLAEVESNVNERDKGESCILEWGGQLRPSPIKSLSGVSFTDM
jgi:tetratricopeptide (TPR) repeat protein